MLTKEEIKILIEVAYKAKRNAFVFKSNHAFGAAIMSTDGEVFGGCNADGIISGQGTCAEICALNHAMVHGKYNIKAVLVIDENEFVYPCGVCLQYIFQFSQTNDNEIEIISAKTNGEYKTKKLKELLPEAYFNSSYDKKLKLFKNKNENHQ